MKKLFGYIGILIVFGAILVPFKHVEAQQCFQANGYPIPKSAIPSSALCTGTNVWKNAGETPPETKFDVLGGAAPQQAAPKADNNGSSCGTFDVGCMTMKGIVSIIDWILRVMSLLMYLSGILLDKVLTITIVEMSENISKIGSIQVIWVLVRNLINMCFIFLLLYEAIKMIIGLGNRAKELVIWLVVASLLMNFSVFFTKVIIDSSNIVAIGFYNSIVSQQPKTLISTGSTGNNNQSIEIDGLSAAFVNAMGVSSFWDPNLAKSLPNNTDQLKTIAIIEAGGAVLFLVVVFVFLAISVMLIIRYLVFLILLLLSPFAFAGLALPQLKGVQKDWWDTLLGQAIFAPIYMIMTWVILTLMSSSNFIPKAEGTWASLLGGNGGKPVADGIQLVINFAMVIGLTLYSLIIAKKYATQGSKWVASVSGKATAFAGGLLLGGAAVAGRNTIGRAGSAVANSETLKEAASKGGFGGALAKFAMKGGEKTATGSFDARRAGIVESGAKFAGIDFGKGTIFNSKAGQGGFKKEKEEREKKETDFAKKLKPSDTKSKELEDIARAENEELKIKQEAAKKELESDKFKESEKEKLKNELENTPEGKLHAAALKTEENYKEAEKDLNEMGERRKKLEKEAEEAGAGGFFDLMKSKKDELKLLETEIESQKTKTKGFKKFADINEKAIEEAHKFINEYSSKEKDELDELLKEKIKTEDELKKTGNEEFKRRVGLYAETFDSDMKRYVKNFLKAGAGVAAGVLTGGAYTVVAGGIAGGSFGYTRAENNEIARKIRDVAGKSDKKLLSAKKRQDLRKQRDAAKEKGDNDKVDEINKTLDADDEKRAEEEDKQS